MSNTTEEIYTYEKLEKTLQLLEEQIPRRIIEVCKAILGTFTVRRWLETIGTNETLIKIQEIHTPKKDKEEDYTYWFSGSNAWGNPMNVGERICEVPVKEQLELLSGVLTLLHQIEDERAVMSAERGNMVIMSDDNDHEKIVLKLPPSLAGHKTLLQELEEILPGFLGAVFEKHDQEFSFGATISGIPEDGEDAICIHLT